MKARYKYPGSIVQAFKRKNGKNWTPILEVVRYRITVRPTAVRPINIHTHLQLPATYKLEPEFNCFDSWILSMYKNEQLIYNHSTIQVEKLD